MQLDNNERVAENKLLILYIINKINFEPANSQIAKLAADTREINYFYLQQYISELVEDKFIECHEKEGKRFYGITPLGKQALDFFKTMIRASAREKIDNAISQNISVLRTETQITADYTPKNENEYMVSCRISEGPTCLIDLQLYAGNKEQARLICRKWENNAQEMYSEIIRIMTSSQEA